MELAELSKHSGIKLLVLEEIIYFARKNDIEKVILFGSRSRGEQSKVSDIDLLVKGGDILQFYFDINEETSTLLLFDIIEDNGTLSRNFLDSVNSDGIIFYEKERKLSKSVE